jgi:hypothetical protein
MVSAAFALVTLLPLLAKARNLGTAGVIFLVLAVGLSIVAGLRPAFSDTAPERLNLGYVEGEGKAWWLADPVPRLPQALRATADFSLSPQALLHLTRGYVAPAGAARHPVPQAAVVRNGNSVTLDLKAEGDGVILILPATAKLRRATVGGLAMPVKQGTRSVTCATPDCAHARVVLELESSEAFDLMLAAYSRGLPAEGGRLLKARPSWAAPSYGGDRSVWTAKIAVPARP